MIDSVIPILILVLSFMYILKPLVIKKNNFKKYNWGSNEK